MTNWALVVGIDDYEVAKFGLDGAASDALAFLDWCLNRGGVPPANVNLLLDPKPGKVDPTRLPPGVVAKSATRDNFTRSVLDLLRRSNSSGDRVFVYFAGHGISARINGADLPCICLRNFDPDLTANAVSLPSVFSRFRATQFKEQYFFVDACRNIPFSSEFQVSDFDRPAIPTSDPYPQFAAFATQPRNTAAELVSPGYEGGAFTRSLLDGLSGTGAAKQWDPETGEYIVRWNSLFKFVEQRVLALKLRSPVPGKSGLIQAPKQGGERGSEDPILMRFSEGTFGPEKLFVEFSPIEASAEVSLCLSEYGAPNREFPAPLAPLPWEIQLPPRIYGVVAKATRFRSKRKLNMVELYERFPLRIEMIGAPPGPSDASAATVTLAVPRGITDEAWEPARERRHGLVGGGYGDIDSHHWLEGVRTGGGEALPRAVRVLDDLVQLEIADQSGRVLKAGRGELVLPDGTGQGIFRARIVFPTGGFNETLVEMSSTGNAPAAVIDPPSVQMTPGVRWAIQRANIPETASGLLIPSEAVGPAAFLKLSTLLALAAGARVEGGGPGGKLRNVPLPPCDLPTDVGENTGGILILLGDELLAADWSLSSFAVSPIDAPDALLTLRVKRGPDGASVAGADTVLPPGSYWLSINGPGNVMGTLAVSVLPNRICLIVLTREADQSLDLHQYSLWVPRAADQNPLFLDPQYRDARFAAIRRIELMQRTYVGGRTSLSGPDIEALLHDKWIDPIAGCLGGYMLIRLSRAGELEIPSLNLSTHFGELPDAWVLRAASSEAQGNEIDTCAAVRNALSQGVPMFAQGVRMLAELASKCSVDHPQTAFVARLAEDCIEGGIFSVFRSTQIREAVGGDKSAALC